MTNKILVELACQLIQLEIDLTKRPDIRSVRRLFDLILDEPYAHRTTLQGLPQLARSYLTLYCYEFEQHLWREICSERSTRNTLRYAILLLQVIELSIVLDEQPSSLKH